jgi:IS30 family transposase
MLRLAHRGGTLGHWEDDTVLLGHKQSGLVTLAEHRTGYLRAGRLRELTAKQTTRAEIRHIQLVRGAARTLTLHNGSKFSEHEQMSKAPNLSAYFWGPYCSGHFTAKYQ